MTLVRLHPAQSVLLQLCSCNSSQIDLPLGRHCCSSRSTKGLHARMVCRHPPPPPSYGEGKSYLDPVSFLINLFLLLNFILNGQRSEITNSWGERDRERERQTERERGEYKQKRNRYRQSVTIERHGIQTERKERKRGRDVFKMSCWSG